MLLEKLMQICYLVVLEVFYRRLFEKINVVTSITLGTPEPQIIKKKNIEAKHKLTCSYKRGV